MFNFFVYLNAVFPNLNTMKPNTYTKLYAHCIFTPKGRQSLLTDPIRVNIHKYIYGVIKGKKCFPVAINGTIDHIHILVGFPPTISISDLIRDVKRSSALYINSNQLLTDKFIWQEGFGAFTVGYRELDNVYKYILNQEEHHSKDNFQTEYMNLLADEGIDFNKKYLFEFYS
jgi:REP-associated tyrosine transposase